MTDEEVRARAREPIPLGAPWWWLSFATKTEFLGVVIVQGVDFLDATVRAHYLGINPGGEVAGADFSPQILEVVPQEKRNVLLGKTDAEELSQITQRRANELAN